MTQVSQPEPLISVLLPVYNGEPYIRAAVESLLGQSYRNFEVIAVNDGSKDGSLSILQSFSDPRVKVISQENCGLACTLNRAIEQAQGDFLARMDADDLSEPDRIKEQIAFLLAHPEVGLVGTAYRGIDASGNTVGVREPLLTDCDLRRQMFTGNPFCHGAMMLRREVVKKVGGYRLVPAEDYDLWFRLLPITKMANLEHVLYAYRINVETSLISVNRARLISDTDRLRAELWQNGHPPAPWGERVMPLGAISLLRRHGSNLDMTKISTKQAELSKFTRTRRALYTSVGLEIMKEYRQRGETRRAWLEWLALLVVNIDMPRELARCFRHVTDLMPRSGATAQTAKST